MAVWMIYVIAVSMVLSAAALIGERAMRLRRGPTRWLWTGALLASLLMPTVIASVTIQVPDITASAKPLKGFALREVTRLPLPLLTKLPQHSRAAVTGVSLDTWLRRASIMTSSAMLVALLASGTQVFLRKRRWRRSTVAGAPVYVSHDVGPLFWNKGSGS